MRNRIRDEIRRLTDTLALTDGDCEFLADAIMGLLRQCPTISPTITWAALPYMSNDFPVRRYALVLLPEEE